MSDVESTLAKYLANYFFLLKKSIRLALPLAVQVLFILASLYFSVIYCGLGFVSDNFYPLLGFYTYFSMLLLDYTCLRLFAEGYVYLRNILTLTQDCSMTSLNL